MMRWYSVLRAAARGVRLPSVAALAVAGLLIQACETTSTPDPNVTVPQTGSVQVPKAPAVEGDTASVRPAVGAPPDADKKPALDRNPSEDTAYRSNARVDSPELRHYFTSEAYRTLVRQTFVSAQQKMQFPCREVELEGGEIRVLEPIRILPGLTHPDSGLWLQKVGFWRCGVSQIQVLLMEANPDGVPKAIGLLPGETRTDPKLQFDLLSQFILPYGAQLYEGVCEKTAANTIVLKSGVRMLAARVIDTFAATKEAVADGSRAVWDEHWVLELCGKITMVHIGFDVDASRKPKTKFTIDLPASLDAASGDALDRYIDLRSAWTTVPDGPPPIVPFTRFGTIKGS